MLIRSPSNNFEVVDLTSAVRNIPIQYGSLSTKWASSKKKALLAIQ